MTRSNASGSTERTKPVVAMPALAITTSMPPKWSTTPSTAVCSAFQSVTSACQERAAGPMRSATRCCSSASSPTRATFAPSAASRSASPAPIPRAAPVMSTTLLRTFLVVHQVGSDAIGCLSSVAVCTDAPQLTRSRLLRGRVC